MDLKLAPKLAPKLDLEKYVQTIKTVKMSYVSIGTQLNLLRALNLN